MTIEEPGSSRYPLCDVSIVNTGDDNNLITCIEAIRSSTILCNVLIAHNPNNCLGGFAKAHNANVKRGNCPFVLILNPDVFVEPDCIANAIGCQREHQASIVGANFGARLWDRPDRFGTVKPGAMPNVTHQVGHVMGAFMLLRRPIWDWLGGFDERFSPLYYEDLDLCFRAPRVWHCAAAKATHIGCATTDRMKWRRRYWHTKNRIKFMWKWAWRHGALTPVSFGTR